MYKRSLVFRAACVGMLLFGVTLITLGAVVPGLKEKFQLNDVNTGTLFSILPLGILSGSLVFGPVCDRYGYKLLLCLSCLCIFAGFEGIAYAPSLGVLKISIYLFGLGGGAVNGATNAVVADISTTGKGSSLSLLGVFFGIGALGMPVLLGLMQQVVSSATIVSFVGLLTAGAGVFFALIRFPLPKHAQGFPVAKGISLLKDEILLLISFFLFCQSSFEAIINNWITTYLMGRLSVSSSNALYALSLFVAGMTVMRLLLGSILSGISVRQILQISFTGVLLGCLLLWWSPSFAVAVTGLVFLGAGLASGFPVMLGLAGSRYADLSATAFSIALVIALAGNMVVNYGMGIITYRYGIQHLTTVAFAELVVMSILGTVILTKKHINSSI